MDKVPAITCSAQEMVFLASLLGADTLLGIEDPFMGWLADEIEEAWQQVRTALAGRRFIEIQPDDSIVMDVAVAALVGTCAFPEASFVLTVTLAGEEAEVHYFHLTRHLAVEQTMVAEGCRLTALEDARAIFTRMTNLLGLHEQRAAPGSGGVLLEECLAQARTLADESGVASAQTTLQQAGLDADTAAALAETLACPVRNGALVALARRETTWEVVGLGLLEGQNGLWRLRAFTRHGENRVEAIPCDAAEACQAVRRVMNRVLPEPLPAR